jgi:NMD protein affecting ribosome stability and mRNA decay
MNYECEENEPEEIDDRGPCHNCGAPIDDGTWADNGGLCDACAELEFNRGR